MPSTPLTASSIGVATVSAMTFGLAPGNCARTTTDGGTTSGYSEIGIIGRASSPATKISVDSTPAKIGRSIKNLDTFMGSPSRKPKPRSPLDDVCRCGSCSHGDERRSDQATGADALQPTHDDALARFQSIRNHTQTVDKRTKSHLAVCRLIVSTDDHHELFVLVGTDRAFVDHQCRFGLALPHAQAGELPRHQAAVGIVKHRPHSHRAALGIDLVVDQLQVTLKGSAIAGGCRHLHRN